MSTKTSRNRQRTAPAAGGGKRTQGGKKGRKPVAPVRVGKDRNWGPILMFVVVGAIAAGIVGYATWSVVNQDTRAWQEQAADIEGIVDYREQNPAVTTEEYRQHQQGVLEYETDPPAYGNHNGTWQNCQGTVYEEPIASEHAVHSLEHGAVWITYRPDLPADQVETLAGKVEGNDFLFLSPYEGLDTPVSLQAWGYQLKVDNAGDPRIDEFIQALRLDAAIEGNATCGGPNSVTATGTTPQNVSGGMGG